MSDFSSEYVRLLSRGALRYSREVGSWSFHRVPIHMVEMFGDRIVLKTFKKATGVTPLQYRKEHER
ncbi:hypothetical protein FACS1894159_03660 [Bacteroidia bacterium]|nr:hypothetical protein FACS1894159_03660 [Bacteroidia bacterium]